MSLPCPCPCSPRHLAQPHGYALPLTCSLPRLSATPSNPHNPSPLRRVRRLRSHALPYFGSVPVACLGPKPPPMVLSRLLARSLGFTTSKGGAHQFLSSLFSSLLFSSLLFPSLLSSLSSLFLLSRSFFPTNRFPNQFGKTG